jgi:hypothetical protein
VVLQYKTYRTPFELIEQTTDFVSKIIEKGEPWTDPDFPPNFSSLASPDSDINHALYKTLRWERLSTLYPQAVVFENITPGDVKQG